MEPLGKTTPPVSPQRWCARTLRHGRADARAQANEHHGDDHDHRDARHPHRAHDEKVAGRAWSGACRSLRRDGPLRCVRDRGRADLQPAQGIGRCQFCEEEGVVDDVVSGVRVGRRRTTIKVNRVNFFLRFVCGQCRAAKKRRTENCGERGNRHDQQEQPRSPSHHRHLQGSKKSSVSSEEKGRRGVQVEMGGNAGRYDIDQTVNPY